jgi:hypothetical protein
MPEPDCRYPFSEDASAISAYEDVAGFDVSMDDDSFRVCCGQCSGNPRWRESVAFRIP